MLSIDQQVYGDNYPEIATDLNNLALLYESMGRYEAALPLCDRSVKIATQTLGPDHPNTQIFQKNLQILRDQMT